MSNSTTPDKRGRGRPPGSMNVRSRETIERAAATGELPHEFLLRIARGELIAHKKLNPDTGEIEDSVVLPTFEQRVDAARNVSPYFAAKLATVEVTQALDDETLDELIQQYAAQAGTGIAVDGESTTDEDSPRQAGRKRVNQAIVSSVLGAIEDQ